jgi:peptidoglycan/LPS O-acetylase OafA/YrhL
VLRLLVLTGLGAAPTWAFVTVGLALTVLPAVASWYLVEQPALRHRHSALPDRMARTVTGRGARDRR